MKKIRLSFIFAFIASVIFSFGSCYNPDDINYKVLIYYKLNGGKNASITASVEKNTLLLGSPEDWGDNSWTYNPDTGDYGFLDSEKNIVYYFSANQDGAYSFESVNSGEEWDTSQRVTKNLYLRPKYKLSRGDLAEYINVNFVYYLTNETVNGQGVTVYGAPKKCAKVFQFAKNSEGVAKLNINQIITELSKNDATNTNPITLDPELGYGYVDWSKNGMRYVFYPTSSISVATLVDNDGNVYENADEIASDITLYFNYQTSAGYAPRKNAIKVTSVTTEGEGEEAVETTTTTILNIDTVFVPGNVDDDGTVHPWPYSGGEATTQYGYLLNADDVVSEYNSYSEVKDMEVLDFFLTTDIIDQIEKDTTLANNGFAFLNNKFCKEGYFVKKDLGCGGFTLLDAYVMSNILTYLYNEANQTTKGFKPLSYVYYNPDGSVFKNSNTAAKYQYITIMNDSNGFRVMNDEEWEYCAKVIVDERQLPDLSSEYVQSIAKSFFFEKGDKTGYRNYFRSINDGAYPHVAGATISYSGSGSGLALASIMPDTGLLFYDKSNLRPTTLALGRNELLSNRDSKTCVKGTNSQGELDYNTRNAAGLWNLSGFLKSSVADGVSTRSMKYKNKYSPTSAVKFRGSSYAVFPSDTNIARLGFVTWIDNTSTYYADCSARFCRTAIRSK